jgi:hypothetical protein
VASCVAAVAILLGSAGRAAFVGSSAGAAVDRSIGGRVLDGGSELLSLEPGEFAEVHRRDGTTVAGRLSAVSTAETIPRHRSRPALTF